MPGVLFGGRPSFVSAGAFFAYTLMQVTSGEPLYLVSACASAVEFVAAFRRYADRTGLFVPSCAPLPAGRRGRIVLTLKDGGVMLAGEAEILQSSMRPTVLHGRPGMTVKFIDPDEPTKLVLAELEKARLAMKPAPSTLEPRPGTIPAEPRPVVPPTGGRIDAANALAECIVIGDVAVLRDTSASASAVGAGLPASILGSAVGAGPPASILGSAVGAGPPASGPPASISGPGVGAGPPASILGSAVGAADSARPATVLGSAVGAGPPPATPKATTDAGSGGKPAPKFVVPTVPSFGSSPRARTPSSVPKMTSIGFPAIDKQPAKTESGRVSNATTIGLSPLEKAPSSAKPESASSTLENAAMSAQVSMPEKAATRDKAAAVASPNNPLLRTAQGTTAPRAGSPSRPPPAVTVHEEQTTIGEIPPKKPTDPMPTVVAKQTDPAMKVVAPSAGLPASLRSDSLRSDPQRSDPRHKATSIGFPVVRGPFETQPLGLVPPATGYKEVDPAPPVVGKPQGSKLPGPRGKTPTAPPLPRYPTPVAPLPISKGPAKLPVIETEDEQTDISEMPPAPLAGVPTNESGPLTVPAAPAPVSKPQRSGGMRASEIMAAIPTEDWTMSPDAAVPTVLSSDTKAPAAPVDGDPATPVTDRAKGPPTGDWSIQLDPEAGWSEPAKIAKPANPPAKGNPSAAISSDKPFTAVQWEDKPTGLGEAKIEIDPTLMEPLKPMPDLDDDDVDDPVAPPPTRRQDIIPPPLAPMPPMAPSAGFIPASFAEPSRSMPIGPSSQLFANQAAPTVSPTPSGFFAGNEVVDQLRADPGKRQRRMVIIASAVFAVIAGFVVVLLVAGSKDKGKPKPDGGSAAAVTGSNSVPSAAGSGSAHVVVNPAEVPVAPAAIDAGTTSTPAPGGTCSVEMSSVPTGAEVVLGKAKIGTTPGKFDLPCGTEANLTFRKLHFISTARGFTPDAGKPNKVAVRLAKPTFTVRVTSVPSGATINVGGRSQGVTPGTIKLTGFEATPVTLTKPGFAPDTQRVSPKANGASHNVILKKGKK